MPPNPLPSATTAPSFREIYRSELGYVSNSLRRLGAPSALLEDLVQDVFLTAHRRFDTYDALRPIRPWLFSIAFKRLAALRRSAQWRLEAVGEGPEHRAEEPAGPRAVETREARALVLTALEVLDLEKRGVFVMHEIDGCPMEEVAEVLGIPLFTAYSRLRRARELFSAEVRRLQAPGVSR